MQRVEYDKTLKYAELVHADSNGIFVPAAFTRGGAIGPGFGRLLNYFEVAAKGKFLQLPWTTSTARRHACMCLSTSLHRERWRAMLAARSTIGKSDAMREVAVQAVSSVTTLVDQQAGQAGELGQVVEQAEEQGTPEELGWSALGDAATPVEGGGGEASTPWDHGGASPSLSPVEEVTQPSSLPRGHEAEHASEAGATPMQEASGAASSLWDHGGISPEMSPVCQIDEWLMSTEESDLRLSASPVLAH